VQTSFLFSARSSNLKLKPAAIAAALLRAAARGVLVLLQTQHQMAAVYIDTTGNNR